MRRTENTPLRFVTAASLFDGHDVSINIMRRMLQEKGAEIIHLGHNRSAQDVVRAIIQENADGVCISSYQGGHVEYFSYIKKLLDEKGASHVKIFGGGGGVITLGEIKELEAKGITKIYSPEDGRTLGLEGIIDDIIKKTADERVLSSSYQFEKNFSDLQLAESISVIENTGKQIERFESSEIAKVKVLGITGTGGAGKSSLIDELLLRFHLFYPKQRIALISVDPTKKKTMGALLGDRIRIGSASYDQFFIRSLATRGSGNELSPHILKVVDLLKTQGFSLVIVESSGIGQASDAITEISDYCAYVMTPEYGAQTQLEKIEMLEAADFVVLNKFEKPSAEDALRDIRKQYRRNHKLFHEGTDEELSVYGTMANQFNDPGVNCLFADVAQKIGFAQSKEIDELKKVKSPTIKNRIIPPARRNYLREISETVRGYNQSVDELCGKLEIVDALEKLSTNKVVDSVENLLKNKKAEIDETIFSIVDKFRFQRESYKTGEITYKISGRDFTVKTKYESLSGLSISKVAFPKITSSSDIFRFCSLENIPGEFPYVGGIFPLKKADEEPKRMFAGEGGPLRTNKRFHYLCESEPAKRLSTAFDSVTLYGQDPDERPDIYGKIGESGVSIATLDDMEDLYKGFDLTSSAVSVSKTINGPAPIILAMFMNAAINQKLEGKERENFSKCIDVMKNVRGTVQADIFKEDQAQNTCIFSLEFALKLMGDVQSFFSENNIRKYYTVSISGYHIAEAGANPISQLAFTLSNGFSYVEYYLSRGLPIDSFCENLSFFFSNGLDPEYTVLGRVARKIWAVTMRDKYGAGVKSQKLKYHIQTSGRSLHAQEMAFNDIRTTLQAFIALSDNCNSLHTNAYDEAVTTPTEESVRRAMAIQLIINREFGMNKTDNPLQGSFLVEELSEIVEEYVLKEFERISDRGGVLGAMEMGYQRGKIQQESLYYESLKDSGEFPIIGVNTFTSDEEESEVKADELTRASYDEKNDQINRLQSFKKRNENRSKESLKRLRSVCLSGDNIFEELLSTVRYCSLGEITSCLFEVGGQYRRNM